MHAPIAWFVMHRAAFDKGAEWFYNVGEVVLFVEAVALAFSRDR